MGQITLYLDEKTAAKMKAAAEAEGMSQSKWVAHLIERKTAARWPDSVACLAGAWSDLPDPESLRTHSTVLRIIPGARHWPKGEWPSES